MSEIPSRKHYSGDFYYERVYCQPWMAVMMIEKEARGILPAFSKKEDSYALEPIKRS